MKYNLYTKLNYKVYSLYCLYKLIIVYKLVGDWGLGIGDCPNPQSPIPYIKKYSNKTYKLYNITYLTNLNT